MTTEKRLIDANALKALFDERYDDAFIQMYARLNKEYWDGVCGGVNWGRNTIAGAPTVDAVEVVHGRWNRVEAALGGGIKTHRFACSECGFLKNTLIGNYCPNCGARMDK